MDWLIWALGGASRAHVPVVGVEAKIGELRMTRDVSEDVLRVGERHLLLAIHRKVLRLAEVVWPGVKTASAGLLVCLWKSHHS